MWQPARPGFAGVEDGQTSMARALGDGNFLLVIDDVWDAAHLAPSRRRQYPNAA